MPGITINCEQSKKKHRLPYSNSAARLLSIVVIGWETLGMTSKPAYSFDGHALMPPAAEMGDDSEEQGEQPSGLEEERAAGVSVNGDDELSEADLIGWI